MIKIIAVGKLKEDYLKEMVNDYLKRLTKYHKVELIEVKDSNISEEAEEILKHIKSSDYIISMAIEGKEPSTIEFKDLIEKQLII